MGKSPVGRLRFPVFRLHAGLWPLAVILLAALCLRVAGLDRQSFWIDEIASLQLAQDRLLEGFQRIRGDVHPPGYFVLLHLWTGVFGHSETAVRWLSVIPSLLTVGALYRLGGLIYGEGPSGDERTGRRIGLLAATLAAGSLIQVYYAQEARSYAWLMLFTTLSMQATVQLSRRARWRDLLAYSAATTALLYTHYFGLFAVAAQNLFMLGQLWTARGRTGERGDDPGATRRHVPQRRFWQFWLSGQAIVGLCFAPWLPSLFAQVETVRSGFWIGEASIRALGTAYLRFASLAGPWNQGGPPGYFSWLAVVVAVGVLAAAAGGALLLLTSRSPRRRSPGMLIGLWLLLPPVAGWCLSFAGLDVFTYRNTMVAAPAFALAAAWLCDQVARPRPVWKLVALAAFLLPSALQAPGYYGEAHKDQWREAAAHVERHYSPTTDGIAFDAPFVRSSFFHYTPGLKPALEAGHGVDLLAPGRPAHQRIWLVRAYAGPRSESPERIVAWGYELEERRELVGIEVFLFTTRRP